MPPAELDTWRTFLNARIAQEQGKDEEALPAFEKVLQADSTNPQFINSKTIALRRLNRNDEAFVNHMKARYAELAKTYVGEHDRPKPWIEGLTAILDEIRNYERAGGAEDLLASVAW